MSSEAGALRSAPAPGQGLGDLISAVVAERLTPDFVEKEVVARVDKLIAASVEQAFRSYSDTGKLIEKAVTDALRVDRLDLPSYGSVVAGILKAQIEARVSGLVAGQLAADMEELLSLAPKEVKLSDIAADMLKLHTEDYGPVITVEVERTEYGSAWVYLDEERHLKGREARREAECQLLVGKDGNISSASFRGRDINDNKHIGRPYGLAQKIRAFVACGTTITLDEDCVVTSVGDY